jgi:hypothetical protein
MELGPELAAGTAKLKKAFDRLAAKAEDGIARPILTASAKVVAEAERAAAPRQSGLLAQAIGTSSTRKYGARLFIAAGVRWGFRRVVTVTPRGKLRIDRKSRPDEGDQSARDPARYLNVLTRGHAIAATGEKVLGKPFIQETYAAIAPQVAALAAGQGLAAIENEFKS